MKFSRILPWILIVVAIVGFSAYIGMRQASTPIQTIQTVTQPQTGASIQKIDFMLDFVPTGAHVPLYVAVDRGVFAKYGLQVNLIPNPQGSAGAIRALAAKRVDFAVADVGTLLTLSSKEHITNVRAIALYYSKNPTAIQYLIGKDRASIANPKDLEGKTVGSFPGASGEAMLPVFCKANGIDCSKIKIEHVTGASLNAELLSGKIDAALRFSNNVPVLQADANKLGLKVGNFAFADYGVDVYGNLILTRTDVISNNPNLVKMVLQGFEEALQFSIAHPDDAVGSILKFNPQLNANLTREEWDITVQLMGGRGVLSAKDPLMNGWIDPAKMNSTINIVSVAFGVPAPDPTEVYTDQFVKSP